MNEHMSVHIRPNAAFLALAAAIIGPALAADAAITEYEVRAWVAPETRTAIRASPLAAVEDATGRETFALGDTLFMRFLVDDAGTIKDRTNNYLGTHYGEFSAGTVALSAITADERSRGFISRQAIGVDTTYLTFAGFGYEGSTIFGTDIQIEPSNPTGYVDLLFVFLGFAGSHAYDRGRDGATFAELVGPLDQTTPRVYPTVQLWNGFESEYYSLPFDASVSIVPGLPSAAGIGSGITLGILRRRRS